MNLRFDEISFSYGVNANERASNELQVEALQNLSFIINSGESVVLLGPSGCGKSTALMLAAGLLSTEQGVVSIDGLPVTAPNREVSFIQQDFGLLPWKNVFENAALGLRIRKVSPTEIAAKTQDALKKVGLSEFARAYPRELSGGMKQRLALARAISLDAKILLLDEPLSALDTMLREQLQNYLLEIWAERKHTQLLVTHSIEEAAYLGSTIYVMSSRPGSIISTIQNPGFASPNYRKSREFFELCSALREGLSEN